MNKKIILLFTLLEFIVFTISCYTTKLNEVKTAADWHGKEVGILWAIKTSGEYVVFSAYRPGRISGNKIVGKAASLSKKVVIDRTNIKRIRRDNKGNISEIISKDREIYPVIIGTARKEKSVITFFQDTGLYKSVSIPLIEVKSVQIRRFKPLKTILIVVGVITVGFIGIGITLSGISIM